MWIGVGLLIADDLVDSIYFTECHSIVCVNSDGLCLRISELDHLAVGIDIGVGELVWDCVSLLHGFAVYYPHHFAVWV